MTSDELIQGLADTYGDTVDNDLIKEYLAQNGIDASALTDEDLDDITNEVLELMLVDQAANSEAAENPFSLENVDAMADAAAAENPLSLDKVDAMADEAAAAGKAQKMANEDNTPVKVKSTDSDGDGDTDKFCVKKTAPKKDKKSDESEDDNAQESEDDPHETKLNSNLIDAVDRKY